MKLCSICKEMKPLNEFKKDKSRPDGYQYRCYPCHRLMMRKGIVRENLKTGPKRLGIEYRFWLKVIKKKGCWGWNGAKTRFGYGKIFDDSTFTNAHRVSWIIHNGPVVGGLLVLHKCDNPECTNPDHLFLGTPKDNMHDMLAKNRGRWRHRKK